MTKTTEQIENLTITRTIQRSEMVTILSGVNHPDMLSFVSSVPIDMNKWLDYWLFDLEGKKRKNPNPTPNPYFENGIKKLSRKYKIVTGFDYVKSVNRRLEKEDKEPNFVGGYSKLVKDWYEYTDEDGNTHRTFRKDENGQPILVERKIWFEPISKGLVTDRKTHSKYYLRYQYDDGQSTIGQPEFFFRGNPIEEQMFESFLTQKDYENQYSNQGLDDFLPFQVCDINNILILSMNHEVYELIGTV